MDNIGLSTFSSELIHKACDLGASHAGIASVEDLKKSPAFVMMPRRPHIDRVGSVEYETGLPEGIVAWPEAIKSVLVIAYSHPANDPYRDCWLDSKNPPGNIKLMSINKRLKEFIDTDYPEVTAIPLNYYVEKGGIWLKDAAVVAGLGILGKNNLLITKEFGPRVRLRAMFLSADLYSTGPPNWDPCENCDMACRTKCPQNAFSEVIYSPADYNGLTNLPGREGCYSLKTCDKQMTIDEENEDKSGVNVPNYGIANSVIKYCRECELNCKIGK
ncbi:MAG TPA: hypothetical protein VEA58_09795 [Anaerovoracaceae bacterium]|nr:hypothetical protein [Anaerovoracaceae bacterium]